MITPTVPLSTVSPPDAPRASRSDRALAAATAGVTGLWNGRSPAAAADAVWVPTMSGALILVAGAMTLATGQPWLFAAIGPTAVLIAASPGHPTTRFHAIVLGHFVALLCGWVAVLLLGAAHAPSVLGGHDIGVARVWASAFAVAMTALVQPSVRAYHPPAAATALLITLGAYRASWSTTMSMMAGVIVVALVGEWLQRVRLRERRVRPGMN
jgi:CBS-domain-containing membrane protein